MSLKLIDTIVNDRVALSGLSPSQFDNVLKTSIEIGDMRVLNILLNHFTGLYDFDERKPYWLLNDFTAPVWELDLGNDREHGRVTIKWNSVTLSDGELLTSQKHLPLLNAFKLWVTAIDNPLENGGKRMKKKATIKPVVHRVILLINGLLLLEDKINLAERHLSGATEDFWLSILVRVAQQDSVYDALFDYTQHVKALLRCKLVTVSDKQVEDFTRRYPFITRDIPNHEQVLGLTPDERARACCWLDSIGFYQESKVFHRQGQGQVLYHYLFKGKIIPRSGKGLPSFEELWLKDRDNHREFHAVPNIDSSEGASNRTLEVYIEALRLLSVVHGKSEASQLPLGAIKDVKISRILQHSRVKSPNRTVTLPASFVFDLMRECYEFVLENQKSILDSVVNVLRDGVSKSTLAGSNPNYRLVNSEHNTIGSERGVWLKVDAIARVDESLRHLGVKAIEKFRHNDQDRHLRIRNNESLFALFDILQGAIQILVGIIMARRQEEMVLLQSQGNLVPNINPYSPEGQKAHYSIVFNAKKTGIGGKRSQNAKVKRPIVRTVACFIWQLEQFNIRLTELGLCKGKLSLFNHLNQKRLKLSKITPITFNAHLDAVCDYFQTSLVRYGNGELRRFYVRQHQFRRFFAMLFFWSKGFDGLDALRWMLVHTDVQHLYHYITESETGAVLNGAKASVLVQGLKDKTKEIKTMANIDKLEALISQRYGVENQGAVLISTLSHAIEDYQEGDQYKTIPDISELEKEQKLESHIMELLDDKTITLEPNFFTITDADGEKINTFTLVLKVYGLD